MTSEYIIANSILLCSVGFYLFVMAKKKISPVSLYGIFGLQWFFYWIFTFIAVNNIFPSLPVAHYYVSMVDSQVVSYFLMFNAMSMFIFSSCFLLFYKRGNEDNLKSNPNNKKYSKYRPVLLFVLLSIIFFLIILCVLFPYGKSNVSDMTAASGNTIHANLRNIFVGLFIFYMFIEYKRKYVYLLYFLFFLPTILLGSRIYLAILTAILIFYLYDIKVINNKKLIAFSLVVITGFSLMGVLRSGEYSIEKISYYFWWPLIMESVLSSYSGFTVINLWLRNQINYYNYFGSYIIDPIMIFVPNVIFGKVGIEKSSFNILGKWEEDHGGRNKIAPYGAYYYIAEAMEAAGAYGIIIISLVFAATCLLMEKLKYHGIIGKFVYYNFVGTFGFGFVKNQFSWCSRYFLQNLFSVVLFFIVFNVIYEAAKTYKASMLYAKLNQE